MTRGKASEADFAARLHQLTAEFGSRYALAKATGMPSSTLQGYEAGAKPGMDALTRLARVGNVDLNWLLTGRGEMRPAGLLPGAVLADVLMVDQYDLGSSLQIPVIIDQIPFSRHLLETKLRLKDPTRDTLLAIEADWNLFGVARGDLLLIDRKQHQLARDGVYLLNLPGFALRGIFRTPGGKIRLVGPEQSAGRLSPPDGRGKVSGILEMPVSQLLGEGRYGVSKVVGRAVWTGRAL